MLALILLASLSLASDSNASTPVDDSDLAPPTRIHDLVPGSVPLELAPDSIETGSATGPLSIQLLREDHGKLVEIEGLELKPETKCIEKVRVSAKLETKRFLVSDGSQTYFIAFDAPCSGTVKAIFRSDSSGGQALGIWQIARRAEKKLESSVDMSFWASSIRFIWPSDGDYYSFDRVHVTRGDHWDVVGHELGHAIYDQGEIGTSPGGEHKIDECYSAALALSEGWASFFSAWLSVDPADPDAKFEYMVPRRAPLRFETIPSDVCRGEKNEWRVTGFFWDLLDLHDDGETANETFAQLWNPLLRSDIRTTSDAAARLKANGVDPAIVDLVWKLNF